MIISVDEIYSLGVNGVIDTVEVIVYDKPMDNVDKTILHNDIFKGDIKRIPVTLKKGDEYYKPEDEHYAYIRPITNGVVGEYKLIEKEYEC